MAELRFSALKELFTREPVEVLFPKETVSTYFAVNVFDKLKMERYLSKEAFQGSNDCGRRGDTHHQADS